MSFLILFHKYRVFPKPFSCSSFLLFSCILKCLYQLIFWLQLLSLLGLPQIWIFSPDNFLVLSYFISKNLLDSSIWMSLRHCQLDTPKGRSSFLLQESEFSILTYDDFYHLKLYNYINSCIRPPPHSSPLAYQLFSYDLGGKILHCLLYLPITKSPRFPFSSYAHLFFFYLLQPSRRLL